VLGSYGDEKERLFFVTTFFWSESSFVAIAIGWQWGLFAGLSIQQRGPVPRLSSWTGSGSHFMQLEKGLRRAGVWEVKIIYSGFIICEIW